MKGRFTIERIRDGEVIERHEAECEIAEGRNEIIESTFGYSRHINSIIFPEPINVCNGEELRITPKKE